MEVLFQRERELSKISPFYKGIRGLGSEGVDSPPPALRVDGKKKEDISRGTCNETGRTLCHSYLLPRLISGRRRVIRSIRGGQTA